MVVVTVSDSRLFSNTPCIFPLFGRELVNGKLKRRHHAALAVGGGSRPPAENFPVQSVVTGRSEDVATTLPADIVPCPGTRIRATIGEPCRVQSMGPLRLATHCGWSRGARTNRGAGCSIILGRRLAEKELVRAIRAAPDRIAGRGGAVRIRTGGMELALVCFYSPPTSGNSEKIRTQKAASVEVMRWVGSMMRE